MKKLISCSRTRDMEPSAKRVKTENDVMPAAESSETQITPLEKLKQLEQCSWDGCDVTTETEGLMLEHVFSAHACRWCGWYGDCDLVPSKEELARHIWATHLTRPRINFAANDAAVWWDPGLNGDKMPWDIKRQSTDVVTLYCPGCGHKLLKTPLNLAKQGPLLCRFACAPNKIQVCQDMNCVVCDRSRLQPHHIYPRTFVKAYVRGKEAHPLSMHEFSARGDTMVLLHCPTCKHDHPQVAHDILRKIGCGSCCKLKPPCGCAWCDKNSFAVAYTGSMVPVETDARQLWPNTNKHCDFRCTVCNHISKQSCNDLVQGRSGCPYCAQKRLPCGCLWCAERSFAQHPLSFTMNANLSGFEPHQVWINSSKLAVFNCPVCKHQRKQRIHDISSKNVGCGYCSHFFQPCGCDWCDKQAFHHPKYCSTHNKKPSTNFWSGSEQKASLGWIGLTSGCATWTGIGLFCPITHDTTRTYRCFETGIVCELHTLTWKGCLCGVLSMMIKCQPQHGHGSTMVRTRTLMQMKRMISLKSMYNNYSSANSAARNDKSVGVWRDVILFQ